MTKFNGEHLIETDDCPCYIRFIAALVNAACNYFFQRRGMPTGCDFATHPSRFPCGKKRTEPKVVRIKKTELSRAKRSRSISHLPPPISAS